MSSRHKPTRGSGRDTAGNAAASTEKAIRSLVFLDYVQSLHKAVSFQKRKPSSGFRVHVTILTKDRNPRVDWKALSARNTEARIRAFEVGLPITEVIEHEGKRQVIRKWPDGHVDWLTEDGWRHERG